MTKATAYHCDTSCTAVKQLRTRKPNSQFKIESNIKDMSINDGFSEMQSLGEEVVFEDTSDRADAVFPADLLAFFIGSTAVADTHFKDATLHA